jgi:Na+-translocating ferredoxin:NAD+ oxidoreductase RnfC subunit
MSEEDNVVAVKEIAAAVEAAGITGAGGAGFPTHVKFRADAEVVLANGAECEPLTHVDKQLMIHYAPQVVAGLRAAIQATGATRGIIGVKGKSRQAIAALRQALQGATDITISELGNFYPSGDEQVMVYDILGRVVPEGGIPLDVGVVVNNIETLYNVSRALQGEPLTHKYVTIIGEVSQPLTVRVPIGVTLGEVLALAGGARTANPSILDGGAMMGHIVESLDEVVTKRTKVLLVLPLQHELSVQRRRPRAAFELRAISACDQCYFCTDYCPRHAQGHRIEPHKLILMLASGVPLTN